MTPHAVAGLTASLFSIVFAVAAHAADPVVVPPKPVILPSDPLPAAIAPVAPPTQARTAPAAPGKQAKKPAKARKNAKAHPAKARKGRGKPV